ncbi:hypothetical protein [Streptomyces sp. NPDC050485]|uniref:hypothetical protein n=1 Tax=Streptomyces sp. NPDC050485 TaxID=3365617 RepID=UPI0037B96649
MQFRLACLTVTNVFAALCLLPVSDRDKDAEILALRHQITLLERQLGAEKVTFTRKDRAFLAVLLVPLPARSCGGCGCWSTPTRSCAGIAT